MTRTIAAIIFICLASNANAVDCKKVQAAVNAFGEEKAIQLAQQRGMSQAEIDRLKRECLKSK